MEDTEVGRLRQANEIATVWYDGIAKAPVATTRLRMCLSQAHRLHQTSCEVSNKAYADVLRRAARMLVDMAQLHAHTARGAL